MKLYTAKIRLHGSPMDEVIKSCLTPAEIKILHHIHGGDAIIDVAEMKAAKTEGGAEMPITVERTAAEERDRLEYRYGEKIVGAVFGPPVERIENDIDGRPMDEQLPVVHRTQPPNAIKTADLMA